MSETASTIIKLLTALTSPKACVKYITVAVVLLFSWTYLEPVITETKVSPEQLSIIILLLGVGIGSLIGQGISWGLGFIWEKHQARKNEELLKEKTIRDAEKEKLAKEITDSLIIRKIQDSFEHLHFEQKKTLRKLTIRNETLDMSDSNNSALEKNGYIQKLVHVRVTEHLVQINPVIEDYVKTQWAAEKESKVKGYLEHNESAIELLNLLEEGSNISKVTVSKELLSMATRHSSCIQGLANDSDNSKGYWLWFEEYLLKEFERQTGRSYIDEVFIPSDRISENQPAA